MTRIPVLDTIRAAYNFTFTHLGTIIGLILLPMVIFTLTGFFILQRFFLRLADVFASNNFALAGPALLGLMSFVLIGLVLLAMMSVPVIQLALGRKTGGFLHFALLVRREWRLFRASFGLLGLMVVLLVLVSVGSSLIFGAGAAMANLLALAVFYAGLIFLGLRFGFLLPAVATDEDGPVLPRSWLLSAGNFWRMLAVLIAVVLPLRLVTMGAEMALEGTNIMAAKIESPPPPWWRCRFTKRHGTCR